MNYIFPLLSVLLGYAIALLLKPKKKKNLKLLLAFSGAFLLSITVLDILPKVYEQEHHHQPVGIFIILGILFQIVLEFFSKGAEHGHVHTHSRLNHLPWSLFLSLCLHAFLEGFPIGHHHDLAFGIAIHHFPIAIILTSFFLNAGLNSKMLFFFMVTFAIMTPLGTLIAHKTTFLNHYLQEITAIVIGILFHISSTIIFESSEGHKFNIAKLSMIVLGVIAAALL